MKSFYKWIKEFRKNHLYPSYEPSAKQGWRAALEHILKMKISSAHCKTELDVLRDWIEEELKNE